jgi:hypothetical protein
MLNDRAHSALEAVKRKAVRLGSDTEGVEEGFVSLGYELLKVNENEYWRLFFARWRDYVEDLAPTCGKTYDQLQRYFLTVRDLLNVFTKEQIQKMGITKAMEMRKAKDYAVGVFPKSVVDAALDPKVPLRALHKLIATELKLPQEEPGDWMNCECEFMVTPEQRLVIESAIQSVMHTDPVIKKTISKSAQMLEVMLRFSMEWLGAYGTAVDQERKKNEACEQDVSHN